MSESDIWQLIELYAQDGISLKRAIQGLSHDDLLAVPIPGKWSTQAVVIHLADAEAAFADRMRRIIAEDEPTLMPWDENKFAARLHYEDQSAEDAATIVDLTRKQLARILYKLPESAFARAGQHRERGRQTLREILGLALLHLDHHLQIIYEKREKLGKSLF